MYMILSSSWLSKVSSSINRGLYTLYVHKAVTFHAGGATYLDEFKPPRRVTYLVNYFTHAATGWQRNDGQTIEVTYLYRSPKSHLAITIPGWRSQIWFSWYWRLKKWTLWFLNALPKLLFSGRIHRQKHRHEYTDNTLTVKARGDNDRRLV
jgi:hypothetical protein